MFEKLHSPQDVFCYKLGAALEMKNTVLQMLGDLEEKSQRTQLKEQLRHDAEETREQIRNLEQEEHTLQEVKQATQELAREQFAHAA